MKKSGLVRWGIFSILPLFSASRRILRDLPHLPIRQGVQVREKLQGGWQCANFPATPHPFFPLKVKQVQVKEVKHFPQRCLGRVQPVPLL